MCAQFRVFLSVVFVMEACDYAFVVLKSPESSVDQHPQGFETSITRISTSSWFPAETTVLLTKSLTTSSIQKVTSFSSVLTRNCQRVAAIKLVLHET